MRTYRVDFDCEHGTVAIHEGLTFAQALSVIDDVVSDNRVCTAVSVTDESGASLTPSQRDAVDSVRRVAMACRAVRR